MLIVEDDRRTQDALRRIFQRKGWHVDCATTLAEGRGLLAQSPDCMILDLMLPGGPGEELLRTVRAGSLPTRVAVCSGVSDPQRLEAVRMLAPDGLLRKPINVEDVCRICRSL